MGIKIPKRDIVPEILPETGTPITVQPLQPVSGDPVGQAFEQIGSQIRQFGTLTASVQANLNERDNQTEAGNAYLSFSDKLRAVENKYYSRKGFNTKGSFDEYREDSDKIFNDTMSGISSGRAQEMFNSISRSRRISSAASLQTYERTQLDKAHLETANALVQDSTQDAIENYNNPIAIVDARNKIIIGVGQSADLLGWGADQEKVALETALSQMHRGVIENMLLDSAGDAKSYMDIFIDEIQGSDQIILEEKTRRYGVLQESQAEADRVHALANADNLSLSDEIDLIKTDDPDVRKNTEAIVRQKNRDDEIAETQARDAAKSEVYKIILDPNVNITGKTNAANSLDHGADRANAHAMISTLQGRMIAAEDRKLQKESPIHRFNAMRAFDLGLLKNVDQLTEGFYNKLTGPDYEFMVKYIGQGGRIGNLKPSSYKTPFEDLTGKEIGKNKKLYLSTVDYIEDQVESGIEPTPQRIQEWIITAITSGEEIEGLWWSKLSYAEAQARGVDKQWLPEIEDHEEAGIVDAIKKWNRDNPTRPQRNINEFNKRLWKRINILKFPPPDPSIKDLF